MGYIPRFSNIDFQFTSKKIRKNEKYERNYNYQSEYSIKINHCYYKSIYPIYFDVL